MKTVKVKIYALSVSPNGNNVVTVKRIIMGFVQFKALVVEDAATYAKYKVGDEISVPELLLEAK
jgi:hypothetical protein